jgi:hypothetical protein
MNFLHLKAQEYLLTDIKMITDEICTKNFSFFDQRYAVFGDGYEHLEFGECPCLLLRGLVAVLTPRRQEFNPRLLHL